MTQQVLPRRSPDSLPARGSSVPVAARLGWHAGDGSRVVALVMDVDGVVSPVHGTPPWDDGGVVAGWMFGPVLVSAALCERLDAVASLPGVQSLWLTDWSAEMRSSMTPFPGVTWPTLADPEAGRLLAHQHAGERWSLLPWWKWWALDHWLDNHPDVTHLVWCDDHLSRTSTDLDDADEWLGRSRAESCAALLAERASARCSSLRTPREDCRLLT